MRKIKFLVKPDKVGHRVDIKANANKQDGESYAIMNFNKLMLSEAIDKIEEIKDDILYAEIWGNDYSDNKKYKCVAIYECE